ncbi:hypothetical protein T484DRAFT_1828320 [Baffinella frigidus]|nr:hypothetical protein T484DRAFT_1828320 [Cryptophyta sp. CCMP2293]
MADEGAALDALYKAATNLVDCKAKLAKEAVDTFPEHAADFQALLDNAKVGPKCKTLALQELPKYLVKFPDHMDATLDILIDLFEVRCS